MSETTAPPADTEAGTLAEQIRQIGDRIWGRDANALKTATLAALGLAAQHAQRLEAELAPLRAQAERCAWALGEIRALASVAGPDRGSAFGDAADMLAAALSGVLPRRDCAQVEPTPWPKLVRDGVPDLIRANAVGREPRFHKADEAEYRARLLDKLTEEACEARGAQSDDALRTELADLLEALLALARTLPGGEKALWDAAERKRGERGGFDGRIVWDGYANPAEAAT